MNHLLVSLADVRDFFDKRDFRVCAFDTETTALNYHELRMMGCSFHNGESTCYIKLRGNKERDSIVAYLKHLFAYTIKSLVMHNAPSDLKVLHKEGITDVTPSIFCTMTAHHLIDENSSHGLKGLALRYLKVDSIRTFAEASKYGFDSPEFIEYACNDAIWTWQLHKIFNKKMFELEVNRLFFEVEMPFQFTIMDLEINGVQVNLDKLEELRIAASAKRFELKRKLYDIAGLGYTLQADMFTGEVEMVSKHKLGNQQRAKIIKSRGLDSPYKTDGGEISVGKETLIHLKGDEFVDTLFLYNIVDKLLSSFVEKIPNMIDSDGRVRASYNNTGTVTGRLSSSDPNMQQNPKVNPVLPFDFKGIFEAPEGKSIVSADYAGQELRLLAIVSGDETLIDAFKQNLDPHLMTGNAVFGLGLTKDQMKRTSPEYHDLKEKYDHERHIGKNGYNFPIIYGTTSYGISKNTGVSEDEAQAGIDKFFNTYPGVRVAINKCTNFLKKCWHVRSLTRRRRRLDPNEKKSFRQAFNFLIQGLASDMIRRACNLVREELSRYPEWEAKIIMIVHDEIVYEIKNEYVEIASEKIKGIMEHAMDLPLDMEVEIGIGKTYSEAK